MAEYSLFLLIVLINITLNHGYTLSKIKETQGYTQNNQNSKEILQQVDDVREEVHDTGDGGRDKTYGMSLAGDSGVVWNKLSKNGGYKYHIDEPDNVRITEAKVDIAETTVIPRYDSEVVSYKEIENSQEENDKEEPLNLSVETIKEIVNNITDVDTQGSYNEVIGDPVNIATIKPDEENISEITVTPTDDSEGASVEGIIDSEAEKEIEASMNHVEEIFKSIVNNSDTEYVAKKDNDNDIVKTYGMSLAGDGGVVWNELQKNSSYLFHVGEPEHITSNKPEVENISDKTIRPNESESVEDSVDLDADEEIESSLNKIEELFEEIMNNITVAESNDEMDEPGVNDNESSIEVPKFNDDTVDDDKPTDESESENTGSHDCLENTTDDDDVDDDDDRDVLEQQIVLDLVKNKLEDQIKVEVEKQIKQYIHDHKDNFVYKPNVTTIDDKQKNTSKASVETSTIVDGITEIPKELNSGELSSSNDTNKEEPETILGVTGEETEIKAKRNEKDKKDKHIDAPVKLEAQNVYGNTVGNGEVTNIFIFNIPNMSDLLNIKPNGTNGVYVFGLGETTGADKIEQNEIVGTENRDEKSIEKEIVTIQPQNAKEDTKQPQDVLETFEEIASNDRTATVSNIEITTLDVLTVESTTEVITALEDNATTISNIEIITMNELNTDKGTTEVFAASDDNATTVLNIEITTLSELNTVESTTEVVSP